MSSHRSHWLTIFALTVLFVSYNFAGINHVDVEDNEFAEFEDFETEEVNVGEPRSVEQETEEGPDVGIHNPESEDDDEATVETEDNEFEHVDEDEYEGYNRDSSSKPDINAGGDGPKITFAQLPAHLRSNWESYYLELLILAGLVLYFVNFFVGRSKNQKIAETWYQAFEPLLKENFALVGDDGKLENTQPGLMKESENVYLLWCSGRTACEAVLFELRLMKRQDLVAVVTSLFRPQPDQVHVKVFMNENDMDTYVMCLANKKAATRLSREMADISVYCPERKSAVDKFGLPANFVLMSEIGEAATSLLDTRVCSLVNKIPEVIESVHFSDQYSGPKQAEESTPSKMPDSKKMLIFTYNLLMKNGKSIAEAVENTRAALQLTFYCMERVKRFRLSKESKAKADKNRAKVEEAFLKSTHVARAEAAAARREEKRRQEKEKILQDDDPEKQRKWEEKEAKRMAKKRMPKMKAIKV
nr:EOG090X08PA [Eurycercus lamellatus]